MRSRAWVFIGIGSTNTFVWTGWRRVVMLSYNLFEKQTKLPFFSFTFPSESNLTETGTKARSNVNVYIED